MTRRLLAMAALAALALGGLPAQAGSSSSYQRVYLLGTAEGDRYWGVDPADPELATDSLSSWCGTRPPVVPTVRGDCFTFGDPVFGYTHELDFLPASVGAAGQKPQSVPVKFHFRLDVLSGLPYTVRAGVRAAGGGTDSAPATQVAPGVFEGTLPNGNVLDGEFWVVSVQVVTPSPSATLTLGVGGASWLELAKPVPASSVPDLQRAGAVAAPPLSYSGGGRTVTFNDANWSAVSFSGDQKATRTFSFSMPADAAVVLAWVSAFDSPLLYDPAHGRGADQRKLVNSPNVSLRRGGEELTRGTNGGVTGRGEDSVVALQVPAGPLTLQVRPASFNPAGISQDLPYTVHALAIRGSRTLRSMQWTTSGGYDLRTPYVSTCSHPYLPMPVTADVTTFAVSLRSDSQAQPLPQWTLAYDLPDSSLSCGDYSNGSRVRFTLPPDERVFYVSPVLNSQSTAVSAQDSVWTVHVDYTYTATAA